MPVIINEFEVVAEPPPPPEAQPPSQAEAQAPTPHEIEQIARRQHERQLRVRAT